ncbi:MAG: MMPL family transporter [Bacteroidales bacterium]|nr:MMPL family transporter [Bacteroidales bacterium]MDD3700942.1 MMPL family transporter [Bacteroidales bacterium]
MWTLLTRFILRNRLTNLIIIILLTLFMGWQGTKVRMSYEFPRMLPASDTASRIYDRFKETFGQDGSVIYVGIQDEHLFELDHFLSWHHMTETLRNIEGVEEVVSVSRMYHLVRNDSLKKFDFKPVMLKAPDSQKELDSLRHIILSLPFYEGMLYNSKTNVSMMMITLDNEVINTKNRVALVYDIKSVLDDYTKKYQIPLYYSGLPYIRTMTSKKIQDELILFVFLALFVAFVILMAFFRSGKNVFFIILNVLITVIFMFGMLHLLGFEITVLTGILPPFLIVIGVENSIFLLNKYYDEYNIHGNKIKALTRVIRRIGAANFLTNATTAAGFASFIITGNKMLVEFGIIAAINIMVAYVITLMMIPIIFSYLPAPKRKHYQHLDQGRVNAFLEKIKFIVTHHRNTIYAITTILIVIGLVGVTRLKTTGSIGDDISKKDRLYKDLVFFETHFNGVMPYEISIDTKHPKAVMRASTIAKIDQLQHELAAYPQFSKPLSVVQLVKFSKQAFFRGDPQYFNLPNNQERNFILSYIPDFGHGKRTFLHSFVDTTYRFTRISVQMANINTQEIDSIEQTLRPKIDEIFSPEDYTVHTTGTSVVFLKGTNYLVKNLISSLLLALVVIALLMALTFSSFKMIIISLIPNLIPQILTAGMMGFAGISIKPSTILIFSVALGISVDNTIHFLSRYRQQLIINDWRIRDSVLAALKETGFSMIYSAVVLFCGFAMFIFSSFGGTVALGYLVSFTLLIALLLNLFVLPSLLLTFDKWSTTKAFKESLLEDLAERENDTPELRTKPDQLENYSNQ